MWAPNDNTFHVLVIHLETRDGVFQITGTGHDFGKVIAEVGGTYYPKSNSVSAMVTLRTGNRQLARVDGSYDASKNVFDLVFPEQATKNKIRLHHLDLAKVVGEFANDEGRIRIERRGVQFQVSGTYGGRTVAGSYYAKTNHLAGRLGSGLSEDDIDGFFAPESQRFSLRITQSGEARYVHLTARAANVPGKEITYRGDIRPEYRSRISGALTVEVSRSDGGVDADVKALRVRVVSSAGLLLNSELTRDPSAPDTFESRDVKWIDGTICARTVLRVNEWQSPGVPKSGWISWSNPNGSALQMLADFRANP